MGFQFSSRVMGRHRARVVWKSRYTSATAELL